MRRKRGILVEAKECPVLLHLRPLEGLVRHADGSVERRYGKTVTATVPLHVVLQKHPNPDPRTLGLGLGVEGGKGKAAGVEGGNTQALKEWAATVRPCRLLPSICVYLLRSPCLYMQNKS